MPNNQSPADLSAIQKKIVAKQFDAALKDLSARLEVDSENIEALYMAAVCHRYLGEHNSALRKLDRLKTLAPNLGRAHQEEGHLRRTMGDNDGALTAFTRASQFNPALEASFRGQLDLLVAKGLQPQARQVKAQLEHLLQIPRPLIAVIDLISQGKLVKAEEICRNFLQRVPHHIEAMRLLADIGTHLGALDEAEFLLESAAAFKPDNVQVRIDYIQVLRKRQKFAAARDEAQRLLATNPDNPQFLSLYAIESMQTGDYKTALSSFNEILTKLPSDPVTLIAKGHALKTSGEYEQAVDAYRAAMTSESRSGEAYYSLANLKTYHFSEQEVNGMLAQVDNSNLSHMDRVYMHFALGKALEDQEDYAASFRHYEQGNTLKHRQSRYKSDITTDETEKQISACSAELFDSKSGFGSVATDPIFIVGLPRAGSTLLEQILSSHSQVDGTLELPDVLSLVQRLRRRGQASGNPGQYPDVLADLSADELQEFGEQYLADTRIHRQGAAYFIDKMPNNFRHLGMIHLMLPNAKIIDARRHPMACCFSGFKQLFAEGQEFTYGLEEIGNYYRDYVVLMDHWDQVLPGKVLRVQYEDVVADLETQVYRILDFCGLPFERSCVDFHETKRSVRTASSEQVRQPIYQGGLEQWRHYESYLDPLKTALGPALG